MHTMRLGVTDRPRPSFVRAVQLALDAKPDVAMQQHVTGTSH